ncbi:unnamed protein product [Rhizoctonia solani]|uniref:Uncharacterized protein n=1 Tax=Rhizoctonia solani TaxID=456999 RepID=A0A8H2WBM8_9AGAM|nr:unnamed protein product [Rhizoctonia solani]
MNMSYSPTDMFQKIVLNDVIAQVKSWRLWDISRSRNEIRSFIEHIAMMIEGPIYPPSIIYNFLHYMYQRDPSLFTSSSMLMTLFHEAPVELRTTYYPLPVFFWIVNANIRRAKPPVRDFGQEINVLQGDVISLQETVNTLREELDVAKGELNRTTEELNTCRATLAYYDRKLLYSIPHVPTGISVKLEPRSNEELVDDDKRGAKRPRYE